MRDGIYPYLSYITAAGDEIVLSCDGYKKWWECYGRKGFAAPALESVNRQYADGATDTLAVIMKPRDLTVQMVVKGKSSVERDAIIRDMASRLIQIGSQKDWGRLKVRRSDGRDLYIDCVYTGGMEDIEQELPTIQQFELNFYSGGGWFYDAQETLLSTEKLTGQLYLSDTLFLSDDLFLTDGITNISVDNSGEAFYPLVDIFGPATVIRCTNNSTGQTLAVDADFELLAGQKLIFDCQEHQRKIVLTDTDGSETDITEKLALGSSLIWPIRKGENDITFYYTDSSEATIARIRYRQRYFTA